MHHGLLPRTSASAAYRAPVPARCSRAAAGCCLDKNLDQRSIEASGRSAAPITGPKVDRPWGIYSASTRATSGIPAAICVRSSGIRRCLRRRSATSASQRVRVFEVFSATAWTMSVRNAASFTR